MEQFLRDSFTLLAFPGLEGLLRSLKAEAQIDSDFAARFRNGLLNRRRGALTEIREHAVKRGDAPERLPPELVAGVVFGVIRYRLLATECRPRRHRRDPLLDLLAPAVDV